MQGHKDFIVLGQNLVYRQPRRTKRIMKKEYRRPITATKEPCISSPNLDGFFSVSCHYCLPCTYLSLKQNPKSESRNPNQTHSQINLKLSENPKLSVRIKYVLNFVVFVVSDFDIRIFLLGSPNDFGRPC